MAWVRSGFRLAVACAVLSGACGCGNPCEAEKGSVRESLAKAQSAHAGLYAPQDFDRAKSAAAAFEAECARQTSRFFLFRSYRGAQSAANDAKRLAAGAAERGKTGEGLMRQEALNVRYEAGMAISDVVVALRRARGLKGNPEADALLGRLASLQGALVEMQKLIEGGSLPEAREKGLRIREDAIRLLAEANHATPGAPK
jgi:hypothetical protein